MPWLRILHPEPISRLHVNDIAMVNFAWRVGGAAESVTVESSTVAVETQTGVVSGLVQGAQVRELPLNGRGRFGKLSDGSAGGSLWLPDGTWSNPLTTLQPAGVSPSAAGLLYLKMFPTANIAPTASNPSPYPNWVSSLNTPIFWRQENIRGDIRLTNNHSLMLRYT